LCGTVDATVDTEVNWERNGGEAAPAVTDEVPAMPRVANPDAARSEDPIVTARRRNPPDSRLESERKKRRYAMTTSPRVWSCRREGT
jgi:hypothetical protein